jgi:hypothetical protein
LLPAPSADAVAPVGVDDSPYMDSVGAALPGKQWVIDDYERSFTNDEWVGIHWAYVPVSWSDIETVPGSYDFSGLDGLVSSARRHGIHLMVQVQTGGDFVIPGPAQMIGTGGYRTNSRHPLVHPSAPKSMAGPLAFWRALARRYMPGGVLSKSSGWNDSYGVRFFEVENEPDALPWITGSWSNVPKDYALYVTLVRRTLSTLSHDLRIVGPALSTGPDGSGCCAGLTWLDQVLRTDGDLQWASDDYRAAVTAGQPVIGAGPSIDVYSYHNDFYEPSSSYSVDRTKAVRAAVRRYARQRHYASTEDPVLWETEGGPVQFDQTKYARQQAQVTIRLIANGVQRLNFDVASLRSADASSRTTNPVAQEARTLTSFLPSNRGLRTESRRLSATSRHSVEAYSWTNPHTGLRSWILWAPNQPPGSGAKGSTFAVSVPVRTNNALVIEKDWKRRSVTQHGGVVRVPLRREDPSPVTLVVERSQRRTG